MGAELPPLKGCNALSSFFQFLRILRTVGDAFFVFSLSFFLNATGIVSSIFLYGHFMPIYQPFAANANTLKTA